MNSRSMEALMARLCSRAAALAFAILTLLPTSTPAAGPTAQVQAANYLEGVLQSGTVGTSAAVAVKGKIVFSGGAGFADLDNRVRATGSSVYNIGSVSKVNTAVAVMQ